MNNYSNTINNNPLIQSIKPFVDEIQAYLVGGYLRDLLLGKESCDIDIVVPAKKARPLALEIAKKLNAHFVALDEVNNIYRVVMSDKKTYIDIADCVGEDIFDDLKRRDFTVNALGYDLRNGMLIDMSTGIEDIKSKTVREICEKNMTDDPLRILRAFRFQSELEFDLSEELKILIKKHAQNLNESAKERINVELVKLFAGKNARQTLLDMDEARVLELLFPEINEIKKIPPNSHHHLNLFAHSIETVSRVQAFYEDSADEIKEHFNEELFGAQKRLGYLKIAAFLHDIGKPQTWQIEPETGRHRFIKHDDIGSKIVVSTLKNLKFSNKQIKYIQKLIKFHIYPANVVTCENFNEKAMMRFFRKMENEVFDVIALAHADRLSARGPQITDEIVNKNICGLKTLSEKYAETKNRLAPLPKLLDGKEIMQILDISQGPQLGQIISALKEAQISGDIQNREEAIDYVRLCITQPN